MSKARQGEWRAEIPTRCRFNRPTDERSQSNGTYVQTHSNESNGVWGLLTRDERRPGNPELT